ncbi:MAG: flagellar basal body L-ring protein FlgH [Azoarcus sp.]|nr:flagellar basal body L-ring protein FlgH [Azoarcus sp.]
MFPFLRILPAFVAVWLGACAQPHTIPPTAVHQPMSVRPDLRGEATAATGAIYRAAHTRPLFEDRRARHPGDTLTINLVERTTAQKSSNATADRSSSLTAGIAALGNASASSLGRFSVEAGTESGFSGQGGAAANNAFNGTITVTVIDVFPNGNLLVSGEKQVAINQGDEFIRFSGVVNPNTVTTSNTVQSTQVADARIEYKGSGFIDESQRMGWLQRFLLAFFPF